MRMPKGMFKRGPSYYVRRRGGGRVRWINLGRDYEEAKRRLIGVRNGPAAAAPPDGPTTVAQAASRWLGTYVATARNTKGQRLARSRVATYLVPVLGARLVSDVAADDLREYRLGLERRDLAPQTVAAVLSDARCMFGWCMEAGLIDRSPVPRRFMPTIQERLPDRLGNEEVEAVLGIDEPYGFVVRFGLGTGLRWGELCRSLAGDVRGGVLHVSRTKSAKVRRVPLSQELQEEIRTKAGRLVPFREADPGTFSWHVRRLSGVERFHPHMMRHTFACRWLEAGGSLPALQQILGHASIATTQRYARLSDEVVREQAQRVWNVQQNVQQRAAEPGVCSS